MPHYILRIRAIPLEWNYFWCLLSISRKKYNVEFYSGEFMNETMLTAIWNCTVRATSSKPWCEEFILNRIYRKMRCTFLFGSQCLNKVSTYFQPYIFSSLKAYINKFGKHTYAAAIYFLYYFMQHFSEKLSDCKVLESSGHKSILPTVNFSFEKVRRCEKS